MAKVPEDEQFRLERLHSCGPNLIFYSWGPAPRRATPVRFDDIPLQWQELQQYFPKGTDLSKFTQPQLDKVALRLNQRPRETLGFETPADKLRQSVASTG